MFAAGSKVCCILTGGSRGFGQAIALEIAKQSSKSGNSIAFVLTARSSPGLEKTKSCISEVYSSAQVHCVTGDLDNAQSLPTLVENILEKVDPKNFTHAIFISNASTIGDPSKTVKELDDPTVIKDYFSMNIAAPFYLVSRFLSTFTGVPKRYVVNISSLAAVKELNGLSFYCTAKAACDMMFKVISIEEPNVRALNYAPGPLETDMFQFLKDKTLDPALKNLQPLKPADSAAKLVQLLVKDEFESGKHIDFYDIPE